ncbi:hypothetical protein LXA43DRAFT_1140231 [Ganoderma leucocontextum]|nr:hypothetical protein LXA43DRAFT_1140231 [Ganoderma leucocontextum]
MVQRSSVDYEMSIRLERLRVREALNARDVAVTRLAGACASVRENAAALEALRDQKEALQRQLDAVLIMKEGGEIDDENGDRAKVGSKTEGTTEIRRQLASCMKTIENRLASRNAAEWGPDYKLDYPPPPVQIIKQRFEMTFGVPSKVPDEVLLAGPPAMIRDLSSAPGLLPSPLTAPGTPRDLDGPESPWTPLDGERAVALPTVSTAEKIEARHAILASLPLPSGIPEDSLTPILITAPYSLHDFVGTTSGVTRLGHYRVFQQSTTTWCPEREEHGYFLTPVLKCTTNPRVNAAHRWTLADISGKLDKPTECFYNKDGKWYYAGIYKSFRLDDLCCKTISLPCYAFQTSQALIKETLAGRKNTSPQNVYEAGQLYSVGALKVACIGLQCIGFNNTLYRGLLEHAALCTQTGKLRAQAGGFNTGLGGATTPWSGSGNTTAHGTPSGSGSPVAMGGGPGAIATGGVAPQTGGMAPGGRVIGPATVLGSGSGLGIGLGLGRGQPLSTPGVRISQHGPEDVAGTHGTRFLGKM